MAEELAKLEDIWVYYDGLPALEGVSLTIEQGDFLGIIGPNGGGKTTLLKVILGLITPDRGSISILGKPPWAARKEIGYIPQTNTFDRNFPIDVYDTVLIGRYGRRGLFKKYTSQDKEIALKALEVVGMLEHRNRQISKLSGGEQQRVFIARALVAEPRLLLLDEPTASVDTAMQSEFYEILDKLKQNMAIVLVSHDIGAVSVHVNKIACLNCQLVYHGSREISNEVLEATYKCPVQMITHGTVPHRVLKEH